MKPLPPITPTVLVRIDKNSAVSVLQDAGVQIVLLDERTEPDHVVMLPTRDQYEEILLILGDKIVVSIWHDDAMTAANALATLYRHRLIVGALAPDVTLSEIEQQQAAQR